MFPRLFCVFFGKYQDKMLEFLLLFKENVYIYKCASSIYGFVFTPT